MRFKIVVDASFEAESVEDAMKKLSDYFASPMTSNLLKDNGGNMVDIRVSNTGGAP